MWVSVCGWLIAFGCGSSSAPESKADPKTESKPEVKPEVKPEPKSEPKPPPVEKPDVKSNPATPAVAEAPEGNPPADGKYERVVVDGVTVPMVNIMEGGTVVLVDTDGKKPRTWEEQYKRKRATKRGQLDVHKTDTNKNGKFDDDEIDKEGMWLIDVKGNITKH